MTKPYLSVVIPAFNEHTRLRTSLDQIVSYFDTRTFDFEIVVVDDGSQDDTYDVAANYVGEIGSKGNIRVLKNERNSGKGFSVRRGVLESTGKYVLVTDADLSTPVDEVEKLEKEVVAGPCSLAFGSRDIQGSEVLLRQSWLREYAGKTFNRIVRFLTALPFKDTQCGFKFFRADDCRRVFLRQRIDRYAFDVEILHIARILGLKMVEVPVVWRHADDSKVRLFVDGPKMILDLLRIRWNDAIGVYRKNVNQVDEEEA
jgi:dolichyl-phosphate beta-glucosyltransferase